MSHDQATGSVVVVTGAPSGIGEATALAFAQCADDAGERLARYLAAVGAPDALFVRADVRFEREIADVIDITMSCFGRLDIAPAPKEQRANRTLVEIGLMVTGIASTANLGYSTDDTLKPLVRIPPDDVIRVHTW
jgi:NAD(P)-dependent dehydrogenase (short-subunit alcohol dehydrogenase family)